MVVRQYGTISDFSGGLNANDNPSLIEDNQVSDCTNVIFGKGYTSKRNGYDRYNTTGFTQNVKSLYEYRRNDGTKKFIFSLDGTPQLGIDNNGTSYTTTNPNSLTTADVKYLAYKDRSINDVVLLADGGRLKTFNATTNNISVVTPHVPTTGTGGEETDPGLNDLANLTNCRAIALKKDRIFLVGHPTQKNRVHFSWIDPVIGYAVYDYIPAIYFFDVATEDNDEIVELKVFRNTLIIFCKKSVWALKGDGSSLLDLELIKINVPNGCIASNSIQEVGNNIFFLGDDGIYSLFASEQEFVSAQIVSTNVQPILKSVGLTDKAKASSVFFDNRYWLSFPSGLTLVYDVTLECWTKFDGIKANSFLVRDGVLYFGGVDSVNNQAIYKFRENYYSDNGTAIKYLLRTKIYNFDLPINPKKFRRLWTMQRQFDSFISTYSLDCMIDQYTIVSINGLDTDFDTGNSAIWDSSNWDEASWDFTETTTNKINVRKKGKDIQLLFKNENIDEPLSMFGFVIEYEIRKPK